MRAFDPEVLNYFKVIAFVEHHFEGQIIRQASWKNTHSYTR